MYPVMTLVMTDLNTLNTQHPQMTHEHPSCVEHLHDSEKRERKEGERIERERGRREN